MVWYVALGSAVGGIARLLLSAAVQQRAGSGFPVGTLLVNVTGAFLLGLISRYAMDTLTISPEVRALLTTGFCGGYTTFSTFSYESLMLLEDGQFVRGGTYVLASVALSLAATWLGIVVARALLTARASS